MTSLDPSPTNVRSTEKKIKGYVFHSTVTIVTYRWDTRKRTGWTRGHLRLRRNLQCRPSHPMTIAADCVVTISFVLISL